MNRGLFITLEGGEGVGKTTQLQAMHSFLEQHGKHVVVTREPGGTVLGEKIRAMLLDHESAIQSVDAELLLLFAARAQHLAQVIQPALLDGQWVLCDRFTDASYAYQGGGRRISQDRIAQLEQWLEDTIKPDLTLLLDAPVKMTLARALQRSAPDRFEAEQNDFFDRVRATYLELAAQYPQRIAIIDATQSIGQVEENIRCHLLTVLNR